MRRKIYVAPSANRKGGYPNPYFIHLKKELASYFEVLDSENKPRLSQGLTLLRYSFSADVFLLSFVETIAFHKLAFIQYLAAMLSLLIMKLRRREVIFIFHNPHPHKGENRMSRSLTMRMLRQSALVLSHSTDTAAYAKSLISNFGGDPAKVKYVCHPMPATDVPAPDMSSGRILIWGNVLPYKGVLEFVSCPEIRDARPGCPHSGALWRCFSVRFDRAEHFPSVRHSLPFRKPFRIFRRAPQSHPVQQIRGFPISSRLRFRFRRPYGHDCHGRRTGGSVFRRLRRPGLRKCLPHISFHPRTGVHPQFPKQLNQTAIRHFIARNSWPAFAEMIATESGRL